MSGAYEKRLGGLYTLQQEPDRAAEAYRKARDYYRHAIEIDPVNYWVITQYLSLCSILAEPKDRQGLVYAHYDWWVVAQQIASWRLRTGSNEDLAWAHGTLAELEMLGVVFGGADVTSGETQRRIVEYCHKIRDLAGDQSFPVRSTRRQFQRYLDWWKRDEWNSLAQAAMDALAEGASSTGRAW